MALSMAVMAEPMLAPEPMERLFNPSVVARMGVRETLMLSTPVVVPVPTWKVTLVMDPSRRSTPLKVVDLAIRSISLIRSWNSASRVSLSLLLTVPFLA